MREYLFRGKRKDNGEWVEGDLYHGRAGYIYITWHDQDGEYNEYEVDPETVGMWTGLLDKNGTKIFEGDIAEFFGMRGQIVQECGAYGMATAQQIDYDILKSNIPHHNAACFCFNDNFISLWEMWWNYEQDDNPLYETEIIGNIHDNPEPLKEGAEL